MDKVMMKSNEDSDIAFITKVLRTMAEAGRGDIEIGMVMDDGRKINMTIILRGFTMPDGTYHEV